MVYFAITGTYGDTPTKHSRMNAEETGEFVVNMVAGTLGEKMNITTAMVAYGVDEMKLAGLTPQPWVRQAAAGEGIAGGVGMQVLEDGRAAGRTGQRGQARLGRVRPGGGRAHRRRHPQGRP